MSRFFVSPSYHKTSRFWTVEPFAYRRQATARVDVRGAGWLRRVSGHVVLGGLPVALNGARSRSHLFKTQSIKTHFTMLVSVSQDTICSRHISQCFTSLSCMSMRCRSLRMSTRKASQDTICSRHDLFMTQSVHDTLHDASFCHTPHVNFSGSIDRVRGVRFCHHLHRVLSSDRVRGADTCCHLRSDFLGHRLRESQ